MQGRVPQECGCIGHFQRGTLPVEAKFRPCHRVKELPTLTSKDSDDGWICGSLPVAMLAYRLEERRQILNDTPVQIGDERDASEHRQVLRV